MPQDWDGDFEDLVSSMTNMVGENEIEARRVMGDENYDKVMSYLDRSSELGLSKELAQIHYLKVIGGLHNAIGLSLIFACVMGLAWSLYYWIS